MTYQKFPLLLDGAMGTALMKAGLKNGESPERWILSCRENEELAVQIQKDYIKSGASALYTPTFGANSAILPKFGLNDKVEEYNIRLASLTKRAIKESGSPVLMGGNMSPTGYFMLPYGDKSFAQIERIYREQAEALEKAGVDFFIIETNLSLSEARAAVYAVKSVSGKPIYVTFSLDDSGRTLSGNTLEACVVSLCAVGVDGIGLNCSKGPEDMLEPVKRILAYLPEDVALIAKPNAGIPCEEDGCVKTIPVFEYAQGCKKLLEAGVDIIGGCCGTDSGYIRVLHDMLSFYKRAERHTRGELYTNGRDVFTLDFDGCAPVYDCDGDLCDTVCACESGYIHIRLAEKADIDLLVDASPFFTKPLVLSSKDKSLLDIAERIYEGKMKTILED